ncbi:MAG TPA: diguanylate cyclase, partial [Dyella sp.]|nr:diguanylate cyclase [Dyella sp.]
FDLPWFDHVGVDDGLPHSVSTAVAQDRRGLIWIGTMGGLVRYDGYRMQEFGDDTGPSRDLPDAYVRSLLALPDGGMLVGTNSGGLSRFDPKTNRFYTYPIGQGGTSDRKIYALARGSGESVWMATERGLDRLDLRTDRIAPVIGGRGELASRNFTVFEDREGNVWLGNNNGLFVRTAGTKAFVRPPHPQGNIDTILKDGIWAVYEDREGRLWVGSTQSGAAYRDRDGAWHEVTGYSGYRPDQERRATVRDFLEIAPDTMWMATDGSGVMVYAVDTGNLRQLAHDTALPSSLPGDSIRALMQDRVGNVWVASDLGVAHTQPYARSAFSVLPAATQNESGLGGTNVRGIYVDTQGRIWLGMSAGRIDMIDLQHGSIRHVQLGGSQTHRDVQAFAQMPDGSIWVGTQGLARISPDTFAVQDSIVPAMDEKPVLHLLAQGQQLVIATYDGVYRYDTQTRSLVHFSHDKNVPDSLASDTVRRIEPIGHAIWYLTGHGISIAKDITQTGQFRNLFNRPDDSTSLPNNLVSSVTTDPQHRLWVGTYGGLAMLESDPDDSSYRFSTIGISQGLSSDNINAVQADNQGNLWVSLPNGVAKIDGQTHAVHNLSVRDGLRISSYIYAAAARAPTGEIMFGGLGGLTVVRPTWKPVHHADAPLVVTRAVVNGAALPYGELPPSNESLTLKPHNRSLRVDFALLDYQPPQETSYSYRMEGFDDAWIEVPRGSLPSAIYTNLPHGTYALHLRATTQGLQSRVVETTVRIVAAPRWYETITAMVGAAVLALGVLLGVVQLRTLYLRRQAMHLQEQVDLRTRDLTNANERLDQLASTDELTGVFNRRRLLEMAEGIRRLARDGNACIALLDLDHFKQVNDSYGHLAGDQVIRVACGILLQHCRDGDVVGRYGGEELLVCLPDGTLEQGMAVAERIRDALASGPVMHEGQSIVITASIGVAAWREGETLSQWLTRADGALYEAKHGGRNRCMAAR